mmetsp:Transcript_7221/g.9914  ORF Transcript_7221/g.9914 Transcript_7221/m.9914 type:complete len:180 (-) Transcript_7221:222-761(-)
MYRVPPTPCDMFRALREQQNKSWAHVCVVKGRNLTKKSNSRADLNQALVCYQQALDLDGENADAYQGRGATLIKLRRFEDAIAMFQLSLKYDPANEQTRGYLDACYALASRRAQDDRSAEARRGYYEGVEDTTTASEKRNASRARKRKKDKKKEKRRKKKKKKKRRPPSLTDSSDGEPS